MLDWSERGLSVYRLEKDKYVAVFENKGGFFGGLLSFEPFLNSKLRKIKGDHMLYMLRSSVGSYIKIIRDIRINTEPPPKIRGEVVLTYSKHLRISRFYLKNKKCVMRWLWSGDDQMCFNVQGEIMEKINTSFHPNLEKLVEVIRDEKGNVKGIISEYVDGKHPEKCDWEGKHSRMLESAINYLHGLGIVHNDISPGNILIKKDGDLVLIDFDAATREGKEESHKCGTRGWSSRELYTTFDADKSVLERFKSDWEIDNCE